MSPRRTTADRELVLGPLRTDGRGPWDLRRVVHLHRRAGFAATWAEIKRDLNDGPDASIDRVLAGTSRIGASEEFESTANLSPTRPSPRATPSGSRPGGSFGCSARPIRWASA